MQRNHFLLFHRTSVFLMFYCWCITVGVLLLVIYCWCCSVCFLFSVLGLHTRRKSFRFSATSESSLEGWCCAACVQSPVAPCNEAFGHASIITNFITDCDQAWFQGAGGESECLSRPRQINANRKRFKRLNSHLYIYENFKIFAGAADNKIILKVISKSVKPRNRRHCFAVMRNYFNCNQSKLKSTIDYWIHVWFWSYRVLMFILHTSEWQ